MPGRRRAQAEARALAFATLVVGNLALILSNRSATEPVWVTLRTPNRALWVVLVLAASLLLAALYLPWAVAVLRFAPLPLHELAAACGLGLLQSVLWTRRSSGCGAVGQRATDRFADKPRYTARLLRGARACQGPALNG